MFQFLRLSTTFLAVLRLSVNPLETLLDCLQSAFSLKIRLVLDLIQRDCKPRCYYYFSSRAYALVSHGKRLRRSRA